MLAQETIIRPLEILTEGVSWVLRCSVSVVVGFGVFLGGGGASVSALPSRRDDSGVRGKRSHLPLLGPSTGLFGTPSCAEQGGFGVLAQGKK